MRRFNFRSDDDDDSFNSYVEPEIVQPFKPNEIYIVDVTENKKIKDQIAVQKRMK